MKGVLHGHMGMDPVFFSSSMNLSHSKNLTDEGLRAVAELKSLSKLRLDGCSLITDNGLRAVAELD
jgi:hypothetical protein